MFGMLFNAATKLTAAALIVVGNNPSEAPVVSNEIAYPQAAYVEAVAVPVNPAAAAFTFGNHSSAEAPATAAVPEEEAM